jgi:hypothetical protein
MKGTVKRLVSNDELFTNRFRQGWLRQGEHLNKLWQMDGWVSPRLGIRFDTSQRELVLYRPDGQRFLTTIEREQQMMQERQRAEQLAAYLRSIGVDPDNLPTESFTN